MSAEGGGGGWRRLGGRGGRGRWWGRLKVNKR